MGSHKYFPYKPHKLFWAHTNTYHTITKIRPQNYVISIKTQTHLPCGQNPKSPIKLSCKTYCYTAPLKHITTWHPKFHCYTAPLKPVATQQYFYKITNYLQKPKYYFGNFYKKAQYYFGNFYKKGQYYFGNFYKEPNTIWQLFKKKPNIILATIYKSPILFWQLFTKDLILLWQHFIKTPKLLGKQLFNQIPNII